MTAITQFKWSALSFTQKFLDLGVLSAALITAALLAGDQSRQALWQASFAELLFLTALLAGWHLCLSSLPLYGSRRLARWRDDLADLQRATGLCTLVLAALAQVCARTEITTTVLLIFWLLASVWLLAGRWLKRLILRQARLHDRNIRYVLIVGAGPRGRQVAAILNERPELGYYLLGFVDDGKAPGVVGPLREFARILAENAVDEVFIALPIKTRYEEINQLIRRAEEQGVVVHVHSELFNPRLARARAAQLDEVPVLTLYTGPPPNWRLGCKRIIDLFGAAFLLVLAAPVLGLIALLIRLTSPGPVLFVQERIGLNKQHFSLFKFRTMVADAEARQPDLEALNEVSGPVFKINRDPRVTPLGAFLRKTSLDELPQLFNVLCGEMSLVGPRPLPVRDVERFHEYWFNRRFSIKPGLTCIWQVSGRSRTSFDRWIKQDLEYIDNWSLALDFKLLLKTIPAVLRGTGAM